MFHDLTFRCPFKFKVIRIIIVCLFPARSPKLSSLYTATIFINWTKEYRMEFSTFVGDAEIPTVNNPKNLDVTFDSLYSFTPHTAVIITKYTAVTRRSSP